MYRVTGIRLFVSVVVCCAMLCTLVSSVGARAVSATGSGFYDLLESQAELLPLRVSDAWYLTDITIKDSTVERRYLNGSLDFGRMSRAHSAHFTSTTTAELYEQCGVFKREIYSLGITLVHHMADKQGRVFAVVIIDAKRCDSYASAHKF